MCAKWVASRTQQQHDLSWRAHSAAVYALALVQYDGVHYLATAGEEGLVKLWRLTDILTAAAAADTNSNQQPDSAAAAAAATGVHGSVVESCAEVLLPHLQNPLGISDGRQPAAQALAADQHHQQLYIGTCGFAANQHPQVLYLCSKSFKDIPCSSS